MRGLIRFDLSGIPSLPLISATLELTFQGFPNPPDQPFTVDVHRIVDSGDLTPWIEGNGTEISPFPQGCTDQDAAYGVAWLGAGDGGDPNKRITSR
jgi:hypothetical protein